MISMAVLALALCLAGRSSAQDRPAVGSSSRASSSTPASSAADLSKVLATYEDDLAALGSDLLKRLDAEQAKLKQSIDRDPSAKKRIEAIDDDRAALLERGEWPATIPIADLRYHWANDHRSQVRDAYRKAQLDAAARSDDARVKSLGDELKAFDHTNDLAPWQDLAPCADLGSGEKAWSRAGSAFLCPAKGAAGGARNQLRFRRAFPPEYALRYTIKWIEGGGAFVVGLLDSQGQPFALPVRLQKLATPRAGNDTLHVAVRVQRDRLVLDVDGERVWTWIEGEDFPVETDPPNERGPEIFVGASDADTRFKVLSAELKCLARPPSPAPAASDASPAKPAPQVAVRYAKPTSVSALVRGLDWLIRHQDRDGGWKLESYTDLCPKDAPCIPAGESYAEDCNPGVTALATIGLLRAEAQLSKSMNKSAVDVDRIAAAGRAGALWLVKKQRKDGAFSKDKTFVYNEALAALALAEAYGLTHESVWKEPAQRGIDFLMRAQRPSPQTAGGLWGWRYASRMEIEDPRRTTGNAAFKAELFDSDISATGWAIMALRFAQEYGFKVDKDCLDGAFEFAKSVTGEDGLVGYVDRANAGMVVYGKNDFFAYHPGTMSAMAVCIRLFTQHDPTDPFLDLAAKRIVSDLPTSQKGKLSIDYYYWYCGSLALDQLDGPDSQRKSGRFWNTWNKAMVEALIPIQDRTEGACSNGAWLLPDRWCYAGGPIYATAINVQTLEDVLGWK
jgi:hypothetical protein